MLTPYAGELNGLCTTDTHLVYRWDNEDCKILFSMTRHGNGMACHFSSDRKGLRKLREAMEDADSFIYENFAWCEMVFANVSLKSVERLVKNIGFIHIANSKDCRVYVRAR